KERNWTRYRREGEIQIVQTRMDSLFFTQKVSDTGLGKAKVEIEFDPHEDLAFTGAFFHLNLPLEDFSDAKLNLVEPAAINLNETGNNPSTPGEIMRVNAKGIEINATERQLTVIADQPVEMIVKRHSSNENIQLYFTVQSHQAKKGQKYNQVFNLEITGSRDTEAAHLTLYPQYPGDPFLGMGGNFRLQNPNTDPQVIDYCLENMEVRMARVELPWRYWHEYDSINPLEAARQGKIHPQVKSAMEMATRLHKMGMPVLLAAWFPPAWAAEGEEVSWRTRNPLRKDRMEDIYTSLSDYMIYLKEAYGVDVSMFSFNESDIGINVLQTSEEHAELIKGLGAYMRSRGLETRLLLGDTGDANGYRFLNAALNDPATWEYIGAVSFHSWRGWKKETLLEWTDAANRLNIPLIVGEGSIDAAAWRYPGILEEPHYAMEEIKLYVRILAICQPQTILQWQLTADYSPLTGGGIFGNEGPLRPTQRFWNLKQLASTPPGLFAMPLACDNDEMFVAALGDTRKGRYAFHLVNDGPGREVALSGLPEKLKGLRLYVTDKNHNMEKGERIRVKNGEVRFRVEAASFTSLVSE
ncbi:MAG: hypothetical protein KDE26_04740, partial [Bacteroidetes bacterium]|nr:hypothetical protein [Bacteroidota bacterium]